MSTNILNIKWLYQFVEDLEKGRISDEEGEEVVEAIDAFLEKKRDEALDSNYEWADDPKNSEIMMLWEDIIQLVEGG